jgi:hypothetical protein
VDSTTIHSQTVGSTIKHYCTIFSVRLWTVRTTIHSQTVGSTNKHYCTIFSVRLWTVRPFTVRLISVQISINEQHLAPQNLLLAEPLTNGGRLVVVVVVVVVVLGFMQFAYYGGRLYLASVDLVVRMYRGFSGNNSSLPRIQSTPVGLNIDFHPDCATTEVAGSSYGPLQGSD